MDDMDAFEPVPCMPVEAGEVYEASASIRGGQVAIVLSGPGLPDMHLDTPHSSLQFRPPAGYTEARLVVTAVG